MGISFGAILLLEEYGVFSAGKTILDFGSSNTYDASPEEIIAFVERHNPLPRKNLYEWAHDFAEGSGRDKAGFQKNTSFAGELFEVAGMSYDSVDIANGYKTTIVDLNTRTLPSRMWQKYDAVLNFGTSEHILNQMNTFAAVHDATSEGGLMLHNVPSVGFVDHGYFCYTSRFFLDLASYNEYEIVDIWYDQADGMENLFASCRQYQACFSSVAQRLACIDTDTRESRLNRLEIPIVSLSVIFRKKRSGAFKGLVETSTSVGNVPSSVLRSYGRALNSQKEKITRISSRVMRILRGAF